ncbi:type VI secretion system contractile sheath small subunit [Pseudomonas gingeri]|uniref:type VI secretion system contractile sheath small subunit n=1 Tax=Pseudomonas gingeri TaxID=117681 RepID=UPI0015A0272A|nr:type VI secretion system contractile sheath small subunit [Pseudomonas gingeri]NWA24996.1 type VI secretion system contractile sheath small subunit [Pseudomonas gingeri]
MAADQESKQKYLGRNRPPRVQITYDVEIGNATTKQELPLVVGILSDLSGNNQPNKPDPLSLRGFVDIDRDSFDTVLSRINPQQKFKVANLIDTSKDGLWASLSFKTIEDFSPENIVSQIDGLKDLYNKRQKLQDLLIKLDGNDDLDQSLIARLHDDAAVLAFKDDLQKALAAPVADPAVPADPVKADPAAIVDPVKTDPAVAPVDPVDPNKPVDPPAPVVDPAKP